MTSQKSLARFFRPRISLRTLLLAIAALCVLFAYFAMVWYSAKRQERAVAELKAVGGGWSFDYRLKNYGPDSSSPKQAVWAPEWLVDLLGPHFFQAVRSVGFGNPNDPNWPTTTDDAMELLQQFPDVREVTLFATQITDRGLEQLERCPDLHFLTLWQNKKITDEAMKSIKKLRRLHTFECYGTLNSDDGLAQLKELPQLRELFVVDFRRTPGITDEGMKHLGEMQSLRLLSIHGADLTDQGLIALENLTQLRELILYQTKVTPEGVKRLEHALPECEISLK